MQAIKTRNGYLLKHSNGKVISEKEYLELENKELIMKDINSDGCVKEITKKINKNKKRIKEITAQEKKEDGADDIIEETNKSI